MKNLIFISISFFILCAAFLRAEIEVESKIEDIENRHDFRGKEFLGPPCIQMHNSIERYSEKYNIPKNIAYGVAYYETRYKGPLHWSYNHSQISSAGALGPMQVMYRTAKGVFPDLKFTEAELKNDIDLNVHCSMKYLSKLYNRHGDWKLALGAYNTGKPCVNDYAQKTYNYKR